MPGHLADLSDRGYANRQRKFIIGKLIAVLKVDNVDIKAYWNHDKGGEIIDFHHLHVTIYIREDHRIDFHLSEFPGTCCWVVMHYLNNYVESLKLQLKTVEIIAKYCRYGGVLITHVEDYDAVCTDLILTSGYEIIGEAYNPHSHNINRIFLNAFSE